ncbi:hypothetical protein C8F01DRAFT_1340450 [Mycena amicta]|nr:hypothetical protein C8F01DRAFT_1340450 [Mycena amicta]
MDYGPRMAPRKQALRRGRGSSQTPLSRRIGRQLVRRVARHAIRAVVSPAWGRPLDGIHHSESARVFRDGWLLEVLLEDAHYNALYLSIVSKGSVDRMYQWPLPHGSRALTSSFPPPSPYSEPTTCTDRRLRTARRKVVTLHKEDDDVCARALADGVAMDVDAEVCKQAGFYSAQLDPATGVVWQPEMILRGCFTWRVHLRGRVTEWEAPGDCVRCCLGCAAELETMGCSMSTYSTLDGSDSAAIVLEDLGCIGGTVVV